jgi:ATP-binding cassette subfamily F protein 3
VLYVSHDRYFINKTASRILELTQREFVNYIGNYDYYLEKRDTLSPMVASENVSKSSEDSSVKLDWKQKKENQAIARKRENDIKKCEDRIEKLESKGTELDEEMSKPEIATNSAKLQELAKQRADVDNELAELYEKWEELSSVE